jgi:DnaJ-domain-containing protein 1
MSRPLMQHGIGQLEALFAGSKADLKVLKQLEHELQYRQVPRAVALLAEVQAAMYVPQPAAAPAPSRAPTSGPQQSTLWERPAPAPSASVLPQVVPTRPTLPTNRSTEPPAPARPLQPATPAMPLEDAYRLLKATPGSTWESIEQTRRQLVQQSHPERLKSMSADRCAQALAEAKRVNAAYEALSRTRCATR